MVKGLLQDTKEILEENQEFNGEDNTSDIKDIEESIQSLTTDLESLTISSKLKDLEIVINAFTDFSEGTISKEDHLEKYKDHDLLSDINLVKILNIENLKYIHEQYSDVLSLSKLEKSIKVNTIRSTNDIPKMIKKVTMKMSKIKDDNFRRLSKSFEESFDAVPDLSNMYKLLLIVNTNERDAYKVGRLFISFLDYIRVSYKDESAYIDAIITTINNIPSFKVNEIDSGLSESEEILKSITRIIRNHY